MMSQLTHELLFNEYQQKLDWINRRLTPDTLEFYHETVESWKHAKEAVFSMYQSLRYYVQDGIPSCDDLIDCDKELINKYPPYKINDTEFPVFGVLKYRGNEYPVYDDDYAMSTFIVVEGRSITVDSFGGECDWYFELDRIIDKIDAM